MMICSCLSAVEKDPDIVGTWDGGGGVKSHSDFKRYSVSMKQISQYCWNISGCGMNIGGGGVKSRSGLAVRVNKQVHTLAEGRAQK